MSSASGVKVSPEVTDAWAKACGPNESNVRALVLQIEQDAFVLKTTVAPSGSFEEDVSTLPKDAKTCATYVYRTDEKKGSNGWHWVLITFVPDHAGVRSKMLHASSKGGLLKALGEGRFKQNMFFTSQEDLTPRAFRAHLAHLEAPAPLSATEQALAQIKVSEAEEALARVARLFGGEGPAAGRSTSPGTGLWSNKLNAASATQNQSPIGPAKGNLKWGPGVEVALREFKTGHADGLSLLLHVDAKTESVILATSEKQPSPVSPSQIAQKLPTKEPSYLFYSWPNPSANMTSPAESDSVEGNASKRPSTSSSDSKVAFVYTCPPSSPVRNRMLYSCSVRGLIRDALDIVGLSIDQKLETSDVMDITEAYLKSELFSASNNTGSPKMPTKAASTDAVTSKQPTAIRQPIRAATAISQAHSGSSDADTTDTTAAQLPSPTDPETGNSKGLPDSAFSMFGPRVQIGSPGGGGFARPRPAGRR